MDGWTRYEIGDNDGRLNMEAARRIIALHGGRNIREAYPDMGTWWGTNQPRVLAFSIRDAVSSRANRIRESYMDEGVGRCFVHTRRTRKGGEL